MPLWAGCALGAFSLVLLLLAAGLLTTSRLRHAAASVREQAEIAGPRLAVTRELEAHVLAYPLNVRAFAGGLGEARRLASGHAGAVSRQLAVYRQLADEPPQQELAARFADTWQHLHSQGELILASGRASPEDLTTLTRLFVSLEEMLEKEIQAEAAAAFNSRAAATAALLEQTNQLSLLLLGGGLAVALLTSRGFLHSLLQGERALRASEDRLLLAGQTGNLFAWEAQPPAGTMQWSAPAQTVIGCLPEELPSRWEDVLFFAAPEEQPRVQRAFSDALTSRESAFSWDFRGRGDPLSAKHFVLHARIEYGPGGSPQRIWGVTQDVTKQRRSTDQIWRQLDELALARQELNLLRGCQQEPAALRERDPEA